MPLTDRRLTSIAAISTALLFYTAWKGAVIAVNALNVIGIAIALTGSFMWMWAAATLGKYLTIETEPKSPKLITQGPFSIVRHPIYFAATIFFIGVAIISREPRTVILLIVIVLVEIEKARREETELAKRFPDFEEYRRRVGFLFPRLPPKAD